MDQLLETTCLQSINRSGRCAMEGTTEGQLAPKSEYHRDVWIMRATPRCGDRAASENNGPPRTIIGGNEGRERKSTRPKELPVAPVSRKLRALANPLESHPYATRACNPHRITFLRKTMGRGVPASNYQFIDPR